MCTITSIVKGLGMESSYTGLVCGSGLLPLHLQLVCLCLRTILQRLRVSNKNICLLGIIMGICGSVIIADWQSVWGDPCDQYSYERLETMSANVTTSDSCGGGGDNEMLPGVSRCVTIVLNIPFMHYNAVPCSHCLLFVCS